MKALSNKVRLGLRGFSTLIFFLLVYRMEALSFIRVPGTSLQTVGSVKELTLQAEHDDSTICLLNESSPSANKWIVRNDWSDQNRGTASSNESGALKIVQRAYGRNYLWVMAPLDTFHVVAGKTYQITFDFKDFAFHAVSGIEVGLASGIEWSSPLLIQPSIPVSDGFTSAGYAPKTVSITAVATKTVSLAIKLKWKTQSIAPIVDYLKNVSVCQASPISSFRQGNEFESGFEATQSPSLLILSPNPTEQQLQVQADLGPNTELEVHDITGTLVASHTMSAPEGNQEVVLDLKSLSPGIYSLLVKSGGKIWKENFVKL